METREKPNMVPVRSSNIAAIGYEAPASRLHVQFKGDDDFVYQYEGVPYPIYSQFLSAPSKGQFHSRNIKDQFKRYSKYRPLPPRL